MLTRISATAVCLLLATTLVRATPTTVQPQTGLVDGALIDSMLAASGETDTASLVRYRERLEEQIETLHARLGPRRTSYRAARRLHRILHEDYLRRYTGDADGVQGILDGGRYNCVSATLFYGLVARSLGYDPQVLEFPGHVLLQLDINGRKVDVETTSPTGFDVVNPEKKRGRRDRSARHAPLFARADGQQDYWELSLEVAVGFVWLNRAWRALEADDPVAAARLVSGARRFLPDPTTRSTGVSRLLVKGFTREYESGRFDEAYEIARIELGLFPGRTSPRDRMLAVALKRVELACEADDPASAAKIVDDVARLLSSQVELGRFERTTCPLITVAAVRRGDWKLARRAAERYASWEPDPVEAAQLVQWVERRSLGDRSATDPGPCNGLPPLSSLCPAY